MKILVINGPNLNMLGKREKKHYGTISLSQINKQLNNLAKSLSISLEFFQSNHEGEIIDFLQKGSSRNADGILVNLGALTHYSYSLRDALIDTNLPIVEVHLSDLSKREDFRKVDVLDGVVMAKVMGLKEKSYFVGLEKLIAFLKNHES